MMLKKWSLGRLFHICWFAFFLLMCTDAMRSEDIEYLRGCFILGLGLFLLLVTAAATFYDKINGIGQKNIVYIWMCAAFAVGMLVWGRAMLIQPFNDSGTIWFSVADIVETGTVSKTMDKYTSCGWSTHTSNHDYFLIYPNSRFMVESLLPFAYFLRNVLGIDLRSDAAYLCCMVLNVLFILLGILFVSLAAKRERGNVAAVLLLALSMVSVAYYLNAYKLYSDTMSMPFIGLTLWLMAEANHTSKKVYGLRFFAGISAAVGILLKGSVWVLVIASIIYLSLRERCWKEKGKEILCLLAGVVLVTQAWSIKSNNLSWLNTKESDRYELPAMHWVMMSAHGDGGYHQSDLDYSLSFETLDERKEAIADRLVQRIKDQGTVRYLKTVLRKISLTFYDGTYCQKSHLRKFDGQIIGAIVNPDSGIFLIIKIVSLSILSAVYLAILASGLINAKRGTAFELLLNVCMFGLVLFFAIWETKSRYLLNYTPMFLLIASLAIDDLAVYVKNQGYRLKEKIKQITDTVKQ